MGISLKQLLQIGGMILCTSVNLAHARAADTLDEACDEQCQATRASQDPTAEINGVFFDNTINFGSDSDQTLYNFEIQGVKTLASEDWGGLIARSIVPVVGSPVPEAQPNSFDTEWGVSDTVLQLFYVPTNESGVLNPGFGPQVSLRTHTDDAQKGAGWGGGIAGGAFGFAGPWAFGGLASHLWGEDDFNTTTIQPIVYYNLESPGIGDWFFGYNAQLTYDWSADSPGDALTAPIGASVGKTVLLPSRVAVSYTLGAYKLVESPADISDWQLKFAINILAQ